jgi:DNA-binding NarL/FixJ family response regulator
LTRVVVVADSGPVLASLTAAVGTVPGAYIVRHGSSAGPLDRIVAPLAPDMVVIGDLLVPEDALARLAEVRRAAPAARVVVLSSSPEAGWLADALRAQAAAVLPGSLAPETLGVVLREVLAAEPQPVLSLVPERAAEAELAIGAAA